MEFQELYKKHLSHTLEALLNKRLEYNKSFDNVSVEVTSVGLSIKWYGNEADPDGKNHFSDRVIPFNFKHVSEEIDRQYYKLRNNR